LVHRRVWALDENLRALKLKFGRYDAGFKAFLEKRHYISCHEAVIGLKYVFLGPQGCE